MITRPEYPSYGHWIEVGHTSLPENFELRTDGEMGGSGCHHMFGDVKGWFISAVAGLRWEEPQNGAYLLTVAPHFIEKLTFAEATFDSPAGQIAVRWERQKNGILLTVTAPETVAVAAVLPAGYRSETEMPKNGPFAILLNKNA